MGFDRAATKEALDKQKKVTAKAKKEEREKELKRISDEQIEAMLSMTSVVEVSLSSEESSTVTNDDDEFSPRIYQSEKEKERESWKPRWPKLQTDSFFQVVLPLTLSTQSELLTGPLPLKTRKML